MAETPKYRGLCETCEHDPTCALRRSTQLEIIQCEEFSIQPAVQKRSPEAKRRITDPMEAVRMGLCVNCANVATCGFPNARQGVLQCEEYLLDEDGVAPSRSEYSRSAA